MSDKPPRCNHCKWHREVYTDQRCYHPELLPLDGAEYSSCVINRMDFENIPCGKPGRLFEPKPPKAPPPPSLWLRLRRAITSGTP